MHLLFSFNKYLSIGCIPGPVLGTGDMMATKPALVAAGADLTPCTAETDPGSCGATRAAGVLADPTAKRFADEETPQHPGEGQRQVAGVCPEAGKKQFKPGRVAERVGTQGPRWGACEMGQAEPWKLTLGSAVCGRISVWSPGPAPRTCRRGPCSQAQGGAAGVEGAWVGIMPSIVLDDKLRFQR